jgi:hypothetical protein
VEKNIEPAIRALRLPDLELIFSSETRPFGREWLERQMRGEVYVAVAEFDGIPVGRVTLEWKTNETEPM